MAVTHTITGGLVHLSGNPIQIILTASEAKLNHRLLLKVTYAEQLGGPRIDSIPAIDLKASFDISGTVDQSVEYDFDYPPGGKVRAHLALAFVVYMDIGESWDDENGDRQEAWMNIAENQIIRVIKGKLSPYQLALYNDDETNFNTEFIEAGKFLTFLPNNQTVAPEQRTKLYYLSPFSENHDAILHFDALCSDGQTRSITEDIILFGDGLFEFSLGVGHMGIAMPEGVTVVSYTFYLADAIGDVSERRTFVVDNNYYEKAFTFYYVNPISGIDSIWLTGQFTESVQTESENAYKPVPIGAGTQIASITTVTATQQRVWELNTGIKFSDEIRALRWFLAAKERWMVDPDNTQKLIPIYIESGEHILNKTDWDIRSLEIKIFEAHK